MNFNQKGMNPSIFQEKKSRFDIKEQIGYNIISKSAIGKNIVKESKKLLEKIKINERPNNYTGKPYLQTNNISLDYIQNNPSILKFALNKNLIISISKYLGEVPVLRYIDIWHSRHNPSNKLKGSQLYHSDWEDQRQIKVYIFLSNVNHKSGPLHLIDAKNSQVIKQKTNYKCGMRLKDSTISKIIEKSQIKKVVGDIGTILICDTSRCLHFGSRIFNNNQHRLITVFQYLRPTAIGMNKKYLKDLPFKYIPQSGLSALEKFVLTGVRS